MLDTLHVITGFTVGGAEKVLVRLLGGNKGQQNVAVLSLTGSGPVESELENNGIATYSVNFKSNPIFAAFDAFRIIRKLKPLKIQTWLYHADLIGGVIGKCAGVPSIFWNVRSTHLYTNKGHLNFIRKILAILSYVIPEKIIYVSESAKILHEKIGYSSGKFAIIENGFEVPTKFMTIEERLDRRAELGIKSDEIVIGGVGRFCYEKGFDVFLKSLEILYDNNFPDKITVVFAGTNMDKNNEELLKAILSSKIKIVLLGEQRNMENIYQIFDIFCLSSRTEAFPNVLCEAMMFKLPCIATDCGDVSKILSSTQFIATPGDPVDLARIMNCMLLYGQKKRDQIGLENHMSILNNYSIEKMRSLYSELYKNPERAV